MSYPQIAIIATIFVASITLNTALQKLITDDKLEHPVLASLAINLALSTIGGSFVYLAGGIWYSTAFFLFNNASFGGILYFSKKRTVRALEFGEKLIIQFKTIDLQICSILDKIINLDQNHHNVTKAITFALEYILSEMPTLLGLDNSHHPELCVLIPRNNKFQVMASIGIPTQRIASAEDMFLYGTNPKSIAGQAMNRRKPVVINDLTNADNPDHEFWVKTHRDEPKNGSLLAFPITRGLGSSDAEPMAILCISSSKKDAFKNQDSVIRLLNFYALKIEILQNCLDLTPS